MKPILFLDVDGVLNCLGAKVDCQRVHAPARTPEGEAARSEGIYALVPRGTRERLAQVLPYFDPVWATAWRGSAHGHFREHLGLSQESWPVLDWLDMKLPNIVRYANEQPWAWVDDDASWELRNLGDHWRDMPSSLIVVPDSKIGITDFHVQMLIEFAEKHS